MCTRVMLGVAVLSLVEVSEVGGQRPLLHTRELVMQVRRGGANSSITFWTTSGAFVWDRKGWLTSEDVYVNPADLEIKLDPGGNYLGSDKGWDTHSYKVDFPGDEPPPYLGRGNTQSAWPGTAMSCVWTATGRISPATWLSPTTPAGSPVGFGRARGG